MSGSKVEICYHDNVFTMPAGYTPPPDRFTSTPGDNLAELAGRVCYDSIGADRRGRDTAKYFGNILTTKHYSVIAHLVETFAVSDRDGTMLDDQLVVLSGRPGVWVTAIGTGHIRYTISMRALYEWYEQGADIDSSLAPRTNVVRDEMYGEMYARLARRYPLALAALPPPRATPRSDTYGVGRVVPVTAKERWCSLYISGVSRDLLQELVRHHWQANPSVRSTRYCDESDCEFIDHAALAVDPNIATNMADARTAARRAYGYVYKMLTGRGVDSKTARGAARSYLPGATATKLVFSLSLYQARHILALRLDQSTGSVDPEIFDFASKMRAALLTIWPDLMEK